MSNNLLFACINHAASYITITKIIIIIIIMSLDVLVPAGAGLIFAGARRERG